MSLGISKDFLSHSKQRHFKDNEHNKKNPKYQQKTYTLLFYTVVRKRHPIIYSIIQSKVNRF